MNTKFKISVVFVVLTATAGFMACSKKTNSDQVAASSAKIFKYQCPMHPQYKSDKPGNCPICGMQLVPIVNGGQGPGESSASSAIPGQGVVKMGGESEQRIGLAVSTVTKRELNVAIKASGRVAYDPTLYSAIVEYQEALKAPSQSENDQTLKSSRLRLRQLGLSDDQIHAISKPDFDASNLLLGTAGGKVWVYVEVYDYEAGMVKAGQKAEFASAAFPGGQIEGIVRAVDSIVNTETRTLRVRAEVPNPRGELKPEMYLSATIHATIGQKLAVPVSAVLDTGMRQLVYVQSAPGEFEPREIHVGREASGFYEVLSGLKEGEMVVTSANFLIDSESKIRAAAQETR